MDLFTVSDDLSQEYFELVQVNFCFVYRENETIKTLILFIWEL